MARLPQPGGDAGNWGNVLNDFLDVEHNPDGTLKATGSLAAKADDSTVVHTSGAETITGTKTFNASPIVPTPTQTSHATTKAYVDSTVAAGAPDASSTTKGIVQLTGDLSGTATSPTVPALGNKADKTTTVTAGTGLTGGGDLSANRTLTVSYGTTAGTVAQGNDARIAGAIPSSTATAKGDILAATAPSTINRVGIGSDGQVLTADSTQTVGVKWTAVPSAPVSSVFGRTGVVIAQSGDYTANQVGALPSTDDLSAIATANATAGNVSMNSHKITNLANGTASTDAATFGQIPVAGTTAGTYAAGNDTRITGALQASNNLSDVSSTTTALSNLGAASALTATAVKTTTYTATANQLIPCDATSGTFTVTLPTAPADKTRVIVKKIDSSTNAVSVATGGSDVFNKTSGSTSATLSLQNQAITLQYASNSGIWYVSADDLPLSQLDGRYSSAYLSFFAVSPTGSPAGDQAAMTAAFNSALATSGGTVFFNAGTYQPTGPMPTIGRTTVISGAGSSVVTIQPTSALTGDLFRVTAPSFIAQQASAFGGFTIDGRNASAGACGLHWGDVNGGKWDDLVIQNFKSGPLTTPVGVDPTALSKGIWIDNTRTSLGITERLELGYVRLYQNTVGILMTVQPGMASANQSFDYQRWKHVQISQDAGQVGIWMKNSLMQFAELNIMANMNSTSSNNSWFLYLDGGGSDRAARILDTEFTMQIETDGAAGTTYGVFADSGTSLTGHGFFDASTAGGGAVINNSSAGTTSIMGHVQLPGIHLSGPVNGWNVISGKATNYTAFPWDLVRCTGSITVTLPLDPVPGQKVAVSRDGAVAVTIASNTGQTINGSSSAIMQSSASIAESMMVFTALSATTWRVETAANTDGGLGLYVSGILNAQGGYGMNISAISGTATIVSTNSFLNCTGSSPYTLTFGTGVRAGQLVWIANASTTTITLACAGSGTINGLSAYSLVPGASIACLVATGGNNPIVYVTVAPTVASVFGRTGIVTSATGDYTPAQVGLSVTTITTTNAAWPIPSGATLLEVTCVGGGGGSGGSAGSSPAQIGAAGGGGASGQVTTQIMAVSSATTLAITIGAGGIAGTAGSINQGTSGANGGQGGTTSVSNANTSQTISAAGGGPGASGLIGGSTGGNGGSYASSTAGNNSASIAPLQGGPGGGSNVSGTRGGSAVGYSGSAGGGGGGANAGTANGSAGISGSLAGAGGLGGAAGGGSPVPVAPAPNTGAGAGGAGGTATIPTTGAAGTAGAAGGSGYAIIKVVG